MIDSRPTLNPSTCGSAGTWTPTSTDGRSAGTTLQLRTTGEQPRSKGTHLMHLRRPKSWWRVTGASPAESWAWRAAALSTGRDGESASGNGVGPSSMRRPRSLGQGRLGPMMAVTRGGPRRRPADNAVDPSRREAGARSPSGARRPAGIEPGNRHGRPPPVARRSRWSSGRSLSTSPRRRRGVTGPGCSPSSCTSSTTAASTTATFLASPVQWSPCFRRIGGAPT